MDSKIIEQIANIFKRNNLEQYINKLKYIKINDNIYKMTYGYILVTYIEVTNVSNNKQTIIGFLNVIT